MAALLDNADIYSPNSSALNQFTLNSNHSLSVLYALNSSIISIVFPNFYTCLIKFMSLL